MNIRHIKMFWASLKYMKTINLGFTVKYYE